VENRYYSLDFWRGVACLMIVIAHSSLYIGRVPDGQSADAASRTLQLVTSKLVTGVDMFFVISGYCIATACDGVRRKPSPASQFFIRRFRRIFPPYWAAVLGYSLLLATMSAVGLGSVFYDPVFIPSLGRFSGWPWLGSITLTGTWLFHFVGRPVWFLLGQAWTLCYEEQFYAVCGLALFFSRRWFFHLLALLTAAIGMIEVFKLSWGYLPALDGFFFDGRWLEFAPGVLLYYRIHHASGRMKSLADVTFCVAPVLLGMARWWDPDVYREGYVVAWAFVALLRILYRWDLPIASSRLLRPGCFCGLMCYSLYLTHWPLCRACSYQLYLAGVRGFWPSLLVTIPLCLALCVGLAWAFHVLVERRFLNTPAMMAHLLIALDQKKQANTEGVAMVPAGVSEGECRLSKTPGACLR
jgi:peptidoglycan/LPS O-acetylase OafA/YrhL